MSVIASCILSLVKVPMNSGPVKEQFLIEKINKKEDIFFNLSKAISECCQSVRMFRFFFSFNNIARYVSYNSAK